MAKYYFFYSVNKGGTKTLYPLPYQDLDISVPGACDAEKVNEYPEGMVFATDAVQTSLAEAFNIYPLNDIWAIFNPGALSVPLKTEDHEKFLKDIRPYWKEFLNDNYVLGFHFPDNENAEPETGKAEPAEEKPKVTKVAVSLLDKIKNDYPCPKVTSEDSFWVDEKIWSILVRNVLTATPTMIVGPSGTGKTELCFLIAKRLSLEVNVYNMGSMHDPMAQLLGTHRLVNEGSGTISRFEYAQFCADIQKPGIIVLDELSRAPLMTLNILFGCLDSRRELNVEMAGETDQRRIPVHPQCVFFATANVGSEYTGTVQLDKALTNRFFPVETDYAPMEMEASLLTERTGIRVTDAQLIVAVAQKIRDLARKSELSTDVSTRESLRTARMVADGWSLVDALEAVFVMAMEKDERPTVRSICAAL